MICTKSGIKTISEVLYVPDIDQNLLSVGQLLAKGYSLLFEGKICTIKDATDQVLAKVAMQDRTFNVDVNQLQARAYAAQTDEASLWHKRMGHVNYNSLGQMQKLNLVEDMAKFEPNKEVCEVCLLGKLTRLPFPVNKAWRAQEKLQLVHTDICGPMKTSSLNGCKYFALFINDCTRFCWVTFLKQKSDVTNFFRKFKALAENQANSKLKSLRSDNGAEYVSQRFQKICDDAGILHQLTTVYTPQQNGVCERKNRTVLDMARCLLFEAKMPNNFWAEAVNTSVYLLNRLPTKAVKGKTPFEAWFGQKPIVSHLKVFGCLCYALVPAEKRTKLERKSVPGVFVGYNSVKKGYRIFDPSTKKVIVSRDVKFNEGSCWKWNGTDASLTEEDLQDLDHQHVEVENEAMDDFDDMPVRGTRTLADIYERYAVTMVEPSSYAEASKEKYWQEAMEAELRMIQKNET